MHDTDKKSRIVGKFIAILAEEKVTFNDADTILELCRFMIGKTAVVTYPKKEETESA